MLHWKELSAWITVDGQGLPEYDVQISEDEKTVTCWVPSEVGKKFSVCFKASSFSHAIEGSLTLDGNSCSSAFLRRHSWQFPAEQDGVTDGTTLKPFMFSALALTDDDSFLDSSSSHPDLGVIQLTIAPVVIRALRCTPPDISSQTLAELKLHERSKKLATQQIGLAPPEPLATPIKILQSQRTGPDIVNFFFKYCSLDVLRAKRIAPQLKDEEVLADALDHTQRDRPLKVTDAISYLDAVRDQFRDHPNVYNDFLDLMKEFKIQSIDTEGVIKRISHLFNGHAVLIQGFNAFVPVGYRIECSKDAFDSNYITVTTPTGTMLTSNNGPDGSPILWTTAEGRTATPGVPPPPPRQHSPEPTYGTAAQYVQKLKQRCDLDTYRQFLDILSKYHHKPDTVNEEEVSTQIARLFKDQPDLRSEFRIFMPRNLEAKQQTRDNKRRVKDEFGNGSGDREVVNLTRDGDDSGPRRSKRVRRG
ncbi:hypothetical protein C8R46DRAFT_954978 [Mycena filopes]|nr:hypothetical protein C8R46DRAFT_954978 [Mycena filopes]